MMMRALALVCCALVGVLLFACGDDELTATVTVTAPAATEPPPVDQDGFASGDPAPDDEPIIVTSPEGDASTEDDSFMISGSSTFERVLVTNVGGSNSERHPDAGETGYPEYRVDVDEDGTWSQRVAIFPGENSIFVEDLAEEVSVERTITGEGSTQPAAQNQAKKRAAKRRAARRKARRAKTQTFAGNGGKTIGKIAVARDATLTWTNDGDIFQIFTDSADLFVNSQAKRGTTAVRAGTYRNVTVNAIGNWTIKIR